MTHTGIQVGSYLPEKIDFKADSNMISGEFAEKDIRFSGQTKVIAKQMLLVQNH